jgi:hypothetical protein
MGLDRRGDVGFMEAMAGAMTVCVVMMCFTAFVAADTALDRGHPEGFDWTYVGGISAGTDGWSVDLVSDPMVFAESRGYAGLSFSVYDPLSDAVVSEIVYGNTDGPHISERRMFSAEEGDTVIPVIVEVGLFR